MILRSEFGGHGPVSRLSVVPSSQVSKFRAPPRLHDVGSVIPETLTC